MSPEDIKYWMNATAFPSQSASQNQATGETVVYQVDGGMTLRDYFAAKALQGILSECANPRYGTHMEPLAEHHFDGVSQSAYRMADAMLKARAQ